MFIDHEHTHQWERIGVNDSTDGWTVIYQCADCDAWTSRTLSDGAHFPFRQGELAPDVGARDTGPLLQRARELLVEARDQVDRDGDSLADDQLWELVQGAAARVESAQVHVDGPEVLEADDAQ